MKDLKLKRGQGHAHLFVGLEVERMEGVPAEDAEWTISGHASMRGFAGDGILLEPQAIRDAMGEYMRFGLLQASHDLGIRETVGRTLDWDVDENGLWVRGMISRAEPDIWTKIQEKILQAFSIRAQVLDYVWDEVLDLIRATKIRIPEISVVSWPMDPDALFEPERGLVSLARNEAGPDVEALLAELRRTSPSTDEGSAVRDGRARFVKAATAVIALSSATRRARSAALAEVGLRTIRS